MRMTRRTAMGGALGGLSALTAILSATHAAPAAGTRHCLTVLYPWQSDARFDFDYYRHAHLGKMRELYGASLGKMEVRRGLHKGDGSPPAYIATATIEILSMEGFDAAGKEHFPKLLADITNYTNLVPLGQIEEVMGTLPIS
jgi:uncharacterized protein (TIGR02118 family)